MQRVAINCDIELLELYKKIVWPLNKDDKDDYKALTVFKTAAQAQDPMSSFKGMDVGENVVKELIRQISVKLSPHLIRIKADFEIICFTFEGIDAIREALLSGIKAGTEEDAEEAKEEEKGKWNEGDKLGVKVSFAFD
jgi:translation initiation factor 2 subunit 1